MIWLAGSAELGLAVARAGFGGRERTARLHWIFSGPLTPYAVLHGGASMVLVP